MGRCCCCNKEIDVWQSNQLKDGEICNECCTTIYNTNNSIDKLQLSRSSCSDVRDIFEKSKNLSHNASEISYSVPNTSRPTYSVPESEAVQKKESESIFKRFLNLIEISALIVGIYLWLSGNYVTVAMDLMAYINEDNPSENPYIQMVYTAVPDGTSQNWGKAFSKALPANSWTYFKNNGTRYVRVSSKFQSSDTDTLETLFVLSPLEEKGTFWIEMCSMRFGGRELSDLEKSAVLATLYEEDVSNLVADYILDSMF